jgi:hypothetical protein
MKYEDKALREALRRKYGAPQKPMASRSSKHTPLWPWLSVAAVALILLTLTFWPKQDTTTQAVAVVSEKMEDAPKTLVERQTEEPRQELAQNAETAAPIKAERPNKVAQAPTSEIKSNDSYAIESSPRVLNEYVHYASNIGENYQAPRRMEDFIAKMANYNNVKGEELDCTSGKKDTTVISMAYLFEDRDELNLFGRLLQAACWYNDKTPGYLLNYSHQQFFFCLKDLHLGLKYLWIAERVNGKILLYSTHSPINTEVSSECFKEYRDKLTHTSIN